MTELREEVARAIANAVAVQDGDEPRADMPVVWPWIDQHEVDWRIVADAAIAVMQSRWQPIETAPRDGTEVLITHGRTTVVAWWSDIFGWRDWGDIGWGGMQDVAPTHWQPLPEPPK